MNSEYEGRIAEITKRQRERFWPGQPIGSDGATTNVLVVASIFLSGLLLVGLTLLIIALKSRSLLAVMSLIAWFALAGILASNAPRKREG